MKNLITLLLSCFLFSLLTAQPHTSWLNYTFSQRLTDIGIKGDNVWISTQGGLVKYNKITGEKTYYNRANSNLPDNNLLGLCCDINGDVWVSSKYFGIGKLSGTECTIYNQSNSDLPFDQLNSKIKLDDEGNVWVASLRWMAMFDGNNWKTWATGSEISSWPLVADFDIDDNGTVWLYSTDGIGKIENNEYSIISTIGSSLSARNGFVKVDSEQNIWITIENEGLYKYNGTTFTNYSAENSCLPTNLIYAISFDSENNMWLATSEGLISFNTVECNVFKPQGAEKPLLSIECDNNNTIWCGSLSGKLLNFNGSDFTLIDISNSPLKSNVITDILIDNENNKWIGTSKNVIKKTNNQFYSVFDKRIAALTQDNNGAIWIAFAFSDTSLLRIDGDEITVFNTTNSPFNTNTDPLQDPFNNLIVDNNNQLWISTKYDGIYKYDGETFTNINMDNSSIPSNSIFELAFDKNNILWGGSKKGLFKYDGTNWAIWDKSNSEIPTDWVNSLNFDSNNKVWFSCLNEENIVGGVYGGGLTYFDEHTMTTYNMDNSGLLTNTIFDIYIDGNDDLWLATCGEGLMSFDKNSEWIDYNVINSGIANNIVDVVIQDKEGSFWMGHWDAGISVFNPDSVLQSTSFIKKNSSSVMVFPNPVKDDLFVKLNSGNAKIIQVSIYDLNGKLLKNWDKGQITGESSIIHFNVGSIKHSNQIVILSLKTNNGNNFNAKLILAE